jgi:hypothetical protein
MMIACNGLYIVMDRHLVCVKQVYELIISIIFVAPISHYRSLSRTQFYKKNAHHYFRLAMECKNAVPAKDGI